MRYVVAPSRLRHRRLLEAISQIPASGSTRSAPSLGLRVPRGIDSRASPSLLLDRYAVTLFDITHYGVLRNDRTLADTPADYQIDDREPHSR
jgi:hypothetical protein